MTEIPAPVNKEVDNINQILHVAIYDAAETAARVALATQFPWTTWPIISSFVNIILDVFAGSIYSYLSRVSNFAIIDAQKGNEAKALDKAAQSLKAAQGTADEQAAQDEFDKALGRLIHYDGSG